MPITRKERSDAIKCGELFYFTGVPCVRGHVCKRRVVNWSCVECIKILAKVYTKKNKKSLSERRKKAYKNNPEKFREKTKHWQRKNPEKALSKQRKWREENWLRVLAWNTKRKTKERGKKYGLTGKCIESLIIRQAGVCVYCYKDLGHGFHIDHKKPLSKGGTCHKNNLQILCPKCNLRKATKTHSEFLKIVGGEQL